MCCSMPIFRFAEYTLPELFGKTSKWIQVYKQMRETFYTFTAYFRKIKYPGIGHFKKMFCS